MDWKLTLIASLSTLAVSLLAGKGIRRLIFLPFEWLASKTNTKVDDIILSEAEKDAGIDSTLETANTLEKSNASSSEK